MESFAYTARDKSGSKISGSLDAPDKVSAIRQLERMGLTPISVNPVVQTPAQSPVRQTTPAAQPPDEMEKAIARQKSYIGPAVLTFFVYWLFYLPGLIVNLLYLNDANRTSRVAGQKPTGYGCLIVLFFLGILPLIFTVMIILSLLGLASASAPFIYTLF